MLSDTGRVSLLDLPILLESLEELTDGFVLFDSEQRLVICNRRYREIYAPASDSWAAGTTLRRIAEDTARQCLGMDSGDAIERWVNGRIESHTNLGLSSSIQRFANDRWIQVNERLLNNGWSVGVRVDVTALKRSEEELSFLLEQAEAAASSKAAFLARMSHEIRTPLNAIIGFSSMMKAETFGPMGNERYKDYIEDVYNSAEYLLGLIDSVLELSRDPACEPLSAGERCVACDEFTFCLRQIEDTARARNQRIEQRGGVSKAELAIGSASFRQIVTNLLTNALKFSDEGAIVTVAMRPTLSRRIAITVIDRGTGIDKNDVARIVLPFEQADSRPFGLSRGMGLGLSIVTGLCERYGGRFAIRSKPGTGTAVRVTLPSA